jgi:NAD(P)-dependent dehydrogenase (short-subunit alcohol dehydrogenase family)
MDGVGGLRAVVAGASSGVGRAVALRLVKAGADVVLVGRDTERLKELQEAAGGGDVLATDLSLPDGAERLIAALGDRPVELLVSTVAVAPLAFLATTTRAQWENALTTNVIGTASLLQAVVPRMAPAGLLAVVSSESVGQHRTALGAYAASKAALEDMMGTWRTEHPGLRFTTVALGGTMPTAFSQGFAPEVAAVAVSDWASRGHIQEQLMHTDDVADVLTGVLVSLIGAPGVGVPRIELASPSAVAGTTAHLRKVEQPVTRT